jgi:phosphonopyruvate decarboxylase
MRKNTVKPCALEEDDQPPSRPTRRVQDERDETGPSERPVRSEALERIVALTPLQDTVVLATTGFTGRQLYALADRPNQLYMVGSMGCVGALGLGLSLARPDLRVVAIDGDGAALMRMGLFATVGAYAGRNFVHILLDNARHESTGGQATVSRGVSFGRIAAACGYSVAQESGRLDVLDDVLTAVPESGGPRFVRLMIRPGTPEKLPRPELSPVRVRERLMRHIGVHEAVIA